MVKIIPDATNRLTERTQKRVTIYRTIGERSAVYVKMKNRYCPKLNMQTGQYQQLVRKGHQNVALLIRPANTGQVIGLGGGVFPQTTDLAIGNASPSKLEQIAVDVIISNDPLCRL
jgi:hypothetical protein